MILFCFRFLPNEEKRAIPRENSKNTKGLEERN